MSAKGYWYCENCGRHFLPMGIMRHRKMHRDRKEKVTMQDSKGQWWEYDFTDNYKKEGGE
jgi:hypothetical protein